MNVEIDDVRGKKGHQNQRASFEFMQAIGFPFYEVMDKTVIIVNRPTISKSEIA